MDQTLETNPAALQKQITLNRVFVIIVTITNVLAEIILTRSNSIFLPWGFILPAITGAIGGIAAGKIRTFPYVRIKVMLMVLFVLVDVLVVFRLFDIPYLSILIGIFSTINFLILFGLAKNGVRWIPLVLVALFSSLVLSLILLYITFINLYGAT